MGTCERVPRALDAHTALPERVARHWPADEGRRPCFFWRDCGRLAELEKQGKAVCRPCARGLVGVEYPLRRPSPEPLYDVLAEAELIAQSGLGRPQVLRSRR